MSYKMTGPLQQAWDREDALGKAYFNDLTNIALANRAAEWAAAQEANRQAQLQDEYAFQDAQNAAARKQRAMENAMLGRRQVQHEYEFGKRLESDAANLAAQKEMEALRIGEQKATKAEQQARQQQQDYFNAVGMATAGKVPWSVLEPVANDLPGDMPNQVRAAYGNMEQTRAQQQLATANALEPLNLRLKTIRDNPIYGTPEMASVRDKMLSDQIDSFKKEWNRVHRSMPFESVFQVTDGYEVFPTVSADTNYQFIQPKPGGRPGEFDVYPKFSGGRPFQGINSFFSPEFNPSLPVQNIPAPQPAAPRTQQQTSAPVAEEPYSFWDLVKFANPFGQAARSLGGTRDRSQASDLIERQRTNAPVRMPAPQPTPAPAPELPVAPERSSYSESAPLEVQGLPTPQLPPEDLVDKVRRLRAEQQARTYSDMPAFRELMAAREALAQQQNRDRSLRPRVDMFGGNDRPSDYVRDAWSDMFGNALLGRRPTIQDERDALIDADEKARLRLDEARSTKERQWRLAHGLPDLDSLPDPWRGVRPQHTYEFTNPSAPTNMAELAYQMDWSPTTRRVLNALPEIPTPFMF